MENFGKILFVEDSLVIQRFYAEMLIENQLNYEHTMVQSIQDAKQLLFSDPAQFDVIILDYFRLYYRL